MSETMDSVILNDNYLVFTTGKDKSGKYTLLSHSLSYHQALIYNSALFNIWIKLWPPNAANVL